MVARGELVLLPEGAQGEQPLQALVEVAKDGGQGQAVQSLQLPRRGNIVHLLPKYVLETTYVDGGWNSTT